MKKVKFTKSFFAMFLIMAMVLFSMNSIYAQDDDFDLGDDTEEDSGSGSDDSNSSDDDENEALVQRTEKEWVEFIMSKCNNEPFSPFVSSKDPFKPIVEKKVIAPPQRVQPKVVKTAPTTPQVPKAPPIKPIKVFVSGIVGNDDQRLAIIKFENNDYTVTKDQIVDGKFKVVDIQSDRITVYSNKEQRRHSFKIGGDES